MGGRDPALTEHPLCLGEKNSQQENRVGKGTREEFLLYVELLGKVFLVRMASEQVPERSEGVSLWLSVGRGPRWRPQHMQRP